MLMMMAQFYGYGNASIGRLAEPNGRVIKSPLSPGCHECLFRVRTLHHTAQDRFRQKCTLLTSFDGSIRRISPPQFTFASLAADGNNEKKRAFIIHAHICVYRRACCTFCLCVRTCFCFFIRSRAALCSTCISIRGGGGGPLGSAQ